MKVSPSLLAADFADLKTAVARIATADMLHLDVMDGIFVPNISFGAGIIKALRPHTDLFFDVHLMIERPERYLEDFKRAGADGISIHYESTESPAAVLKTIREMGISPAITISPDTPAEVVFPLLPLVDMVLIMTVYPGFGGQKLIPACLQKARAIKDEILRQNLPVLVQADGGVGPANIAEVAAAGVDVAVAGSAVFGAADPAAVIAAMKATRK
ncbi:MAG: ribulose-phosphate 3-epimerase [Clostridia bacterium]|nr:ribulose-phosphate 3-epimerase [Clostridia bacterium]